jgi:hypothetical protein
VSSKRLRARGKNRRALDRWYSTHAIGLQKLGLWKKVLAEKLCTGLIWSRAEPFAAQDNKIAGLRCRGPYDPEPHDTRILIPLRYGAHQNTLVAIWRPAMATFLIRGQSAIRWFGSVAAADQDHEDRPKLVHERPPFILDD